MGKYNFDLPVPRRGTNCYKWDDLKNTYGKEDLLPFWIADTEFCTLPELTDALMERIKKPAYSYTFPDDGFFESIIHWYKKRHHVTIMRGEVFPAPGVVFAVARIIETFTQEGDAVIINQPVYESFLDTIPRLKRKIADAPLLFQNGRYELDFDAIEAQMKAGAKVYNDDVASINLGDRVTSYLLSKNVEGFEGDGAGCPYLGNVVVYEN